MKTLRQAGLDLAASTARKLQMQGKLNDRTLSEALGCSISTARKLRRQLQKQGRYPGQARQGRPTTRPFDQTYWGKRVSRMKDGDLTELESQAVTEAVRLAREHGGVVPIGELADAVKVTRTHAALLYAALRRAGHCRWPGSGWRLS